MTQLIKRQTISLSGALPQVKTGDTFIDYHLNLHLSKQRKDFYNYACYIVWSGNNIPAGIKINDFVIAYTQNGLVYSEDKRIVGQYDRIYIGQDGVFAMVVYYREGEE